MNMTIEQAQQKHEKNLFALPNVVGTAVGQKRQFGKGVGRIAITVFVKVKVPETALSLADIIPKMLDTYETDVVETGGIWALGS